MSECLECQKLKRENERLNDELVIYVNRWLQLKGFIGREEEKADNQREMLAGARIPK